ncbi:hypothetical protein NKV53_10415 [Legionella sp. 27cVA30]|uniref:protein kinase domain-containing protein n=1 Tax=Legionella sp. 27cVA30 TaxID=2905657 RepID=UPI00209FACA1|nr:hypothetical protein [Legionella sp. 27cVA30]MCP0914736.1 hypothetical protein [Legionella sp. 27cVA30]
MKYTTSKSSDDSEYESEGGTTYRWENAKKIIGQGKYAYARRFISPFSGKTKAVLSPNEKEKEKIDFSEAQNKFCFFNALHPKQCHLVKLENTYRLVLPEVPGKLYRHYKESFITKVQQAEFFLSAVRALKKAHDAKIIVMDLHEKNIFFEDESKVSYLIDGGLSHCSQAPLTGVFKCDTQSELEYKKVKYKQLPPECWHLKIHSVLAAPAMDIYSLGTMMERMLGFYIHPQIKQLAVLCQQENPVKRPTLSTLEEQLTHLLTEHTIEQVLKIVLEEEDSSGHHNRSCHL